MQLAAARTAAEALNGIGQDDEAYDEFCVTARFVNADLDGYSAAERLSFSYSTYDGRDKEESDYAKVQLLLNRAAQQEDGTEIDPTMPVMVLEFYWYGVEEPVDATVFIRLNPGEAKTIFTKLSQAN